MIRLVLSLFCTVAPLCAALLIMRRYHAYHAGVPARDDTYFSQSRSRNIRQARRMATWGVLCSTAAALALALFFPATPAWLAWIPLFVSVIGIVAVVLSPLGHTTPATFARMLCIHAASLGMVIVHDLIASMLLWAIVVIPMWRELRAHTASQAASRMFVQYMLPSMILVGIGTWLLDQGHVAAAMIPLAIGISIREAVVPLHRWFVKMIEQAPLGMVVMFSMPQLGVLMHLRFLAHHLPSSWVLLVASVGVITAIIGAIAGMVQSQARKALAYLIISQSGLVAFGLEPTSEVAHTGALLVWLVVGITTAGFTMSIAALEARRGALWLDHPTGNFERIPRLAASFLLLGLASVGLPGTLGFIAEDLLVQGSVDDFPVLALALIVSTAMNGITVMRSFFALFTGSSAHTGEHDLTPREVIVLSMVFAIFIVGGIWPGSAIALFSYG